MGKPVKLTDQTTPWFQRELKRRIGVRILLQRILIVCEGKKTEPNYFEALKAHLPKQMVELDICGDGFNTVSLVEQAIALRDAKKDTEQPYDQIWAVFDCDSFKANFDNAIYKAEANDIKCAWTNEAFELWYVLHFEYRNTPMPREDYERRLEELMQRPYVKKAPDMYQELAKKGDQARAIQWARKLEEERKAAGLSPLQANPCTTVSELVDRLNEFRPRRVTGT